jgi:hypothetical protein
VSRFFHTRVPLAVVLAAAAGCGDGSGPGGGTVLDCNEVVPTALSPGQLALVDASDTACIRIAEAGSGGADYLYLAYSAAGEESRGGTSAEYQLTGTAGTPPPAAAVRPDGRAARLQATAAQRFHSRLRALGQDLARSRPGPRLRARAAPSVRAAPPSPGEERTFNVLRSADVSGSQPGDYLQVEGTARYVGAHTAIFLDNAAPVEGGYTQDDLTAIGTLFDDYLHPIDVDAFGSETDVNGDGLVLVLLTNRVTRLVGCGQDQIVVGLFFAVDLIADHVGSNNAEIFYGLAPDEACEVNRVQAVRALPGVFIHEFQHMINYGQHVLQRDGDAEDTWLDEGLAGLAEELGGRLVPDDRCVNSDCLTQFHSGNFVNAYLYLAQLDNAYLIGPRQPPLPLTEYGATWLFVRWLSDHFAADTTLGTDLTRALVQTTRTGADNVVGATETPFDRLIGEWQLANYLEGHPDFEDLTAGTRFQYTSWDIREVFASFNQQDPIEFPRVYPLEPDVFAGADYVRNGVLRAGSGQHLLVEHAPAAPALDLLLTSPDAANPLHPAVSPRAILLRLR